LAVVFIIRLFSTSAFRVPKFGHNLRKYSSRLFFGHNVWNGRL